MRAYDRDSGKELWQHSLPNGAEGMPATDQVNGRQFVVLPVAQPTGTLPATFNNAGAARGAGPAAAPAPGAAPAAPAAGAAQGAPPAGDAAQGGRAGGAAGRQGRGGGGPALPSAYIAFALPQ